MTEIAENRLTFSIFLQVHNSRSEMIRNDLGDNIMEIKHAKGTDRWLVIKKQLDASNVRRQLTIILKVEIYFLFSENKAGEKSLSSLKSLIFKWFQG